MRKILIAAALVVAIASLVAGCRQAKKSARQMPLKGESSATALALPQESVAVDATALQDIAPVEALVETATIAQSCPGIDWRQRPANQSKESKISRADVILASLAAAETEGAEVLCLSGDGADATRKSERLFTQAPASALAVAMAPAVKGPELTWKSSSLQIASITPAEVLVCVPGESEPVASPATEEPAKGKKDAKASEFEWDPREWVESIFADSRPITRQTGEM